MFAVFIPPVLVILIFAVGFVMWQKADLRSEEDFSLPAKVLRELSIEGALPAKVLHELSINDVRPKVDLMTSRLAWLATVTLFFVSALSGILVSVIVIWRMR